MPVCAQAVQQPDGSFLIGLIPAVTDLTTCAYVVQTGGESGFHALFDLSPNDAALIASAVALVWGMCWSFRILGKYLYNFIDRNDDE